MEDTPTWLNRFPMWDAYFGLVAVGTSGFVATTGSVPVVARAWAVALLAGLAAWYWLYGRPLIRGEIEDRRAYLYFAGVVVLMTPAVALVSVSSFALLALCPQAYMLMDALRATIAVLVLNVADVAVAYESTRDLADTVAGPLPVAATIVVGSAVFGTWARRVTTQNDERARLIRQLDGSRAEVARLSHEAGMLAERQRLAGDIHDTVAQGLTSVIMLIQAADAELERDVAQARRHLGLALDTARDNLSEARALVGALTPTELDGSSLADALARLVDRFGRETGVRVDFSTEGEPVGLATAVEVVLLRAVQESLANIRRHAGAGLVTVRLAHLGGTVAVEVADDGRGFDPEKASGGYGLGAMRARVEQVSGKLSVDSEPGRGTTIRVEVPDL
ncbi:MULTISPECIES: sensor histidine kinase [Polymorphospora]|uniref:Oxygen sensor histidine kinase NreB n=1 Tax=Polymorphospora lycopeni TaxID=3140240 RepID=A0ABV5CYI4_9ACTN